MSQEQEDKPHGRNRGVLLAFLVVVVTLVIVFAAFTVALVIYDNDNAGYVTNTPQMVVYNTPQQSQPSQAELPELGQTWKEQTYGNPDDDQDIHTTVNVQLSGGSYGGYYKPYYKYPKSYGYSYPYYNKYPNYYNKYSYPKHYFYYSNSYGTYHKYGYY